MARSDNDYKPPASEALLDPMRRLAVAAAIQAIKDLYSPDLLKQADAILWLIDPGPIGAASWLECIGIMDSGEPAEIMGRLCDAKTKQRFNRNASS